MQKIKVGTAEPIFKLAHAVLSDKKDEEILNLIEQTYKLDKVDIESYREWPLFQTLRQNHELNIKIESILLKEEQKN